jgi:hypothetical protein
VVGIWIAGENASATADAGRGAVARLGFVIRCAIDFDQHRVINIRSKRIFHGIYAVAVRGYLDSVASPRSNVLHECMCCRRATVAQCVRENQLGISVNGYPFPLEEVLMG